MEILKTIIYGILEGITEWLPISSTGHLILLKELIPLNISAEFWSLFEVVIQLGAIMAVILIYFSKLWPFSIKEKKVKKDTFNMWFKVLISCIPAAIIGILFDEIFEKYFYNKISISIALIVIGVLFILIEKCYKKEFKINSIKEITYLSAFIIGCAQVIAAIFPGTSRSGITIICALLLGISRSTATEFTFFMSIPVMLGASLLKLFKFGLTFTSNEIIILIIGCVVSFITSLFAIKFLINYIKKHDFTVFGIYRIILGIIILLSLL